MPASGYRAIRTRSTVLYGRRWRLYAPPSFTLPPIAEWLVLQERKYSRILVEPGAARLAKLIRPRSLPRDALRKYVACQARREWQAARILSGLGIRSPRVYAYGFTVGPRAPFESLSIMDYLQAHVPLRDLLEIECDPRRREAILRRVALDLGTIFANGYVHKDPHFENVLIDHRDRPVWIDSELRRRQRTADLQTGLTKGVALLRQSAGPRVEEAEWRQFRRQLQEVLGAARPKRIMRA